MTVAFRKVWRDLWNNKGRTILVVLSIAVGVMAIGMILSTNAVLVRQMTAAQIASQPSHVILGLRGLVDDDTVRVIERLPEVAAAQGEAGAAIRWKPTLDAEWKPASLTMRDFENQVFDLIELRSGAWPDSNSVAVEFNHVEPFGAPPIGGIIYIEVNERAKAVTIGGTVRDPLVFPPPFNSDPNFYVSRSMLERLVGWSDYNVIRFSVPEYSEDAARAAADSVEDKLIKTGISAGVPFIQDPQRHFLQDIMDGVGLVLVVMAIVSLGLSTILVINTINAVIAQQVPQIGIMKTVGGLSQEIATLYLAGVAVYGLLSLMVAVPIGAWGGMALSQWMLGLINVPSSPFEILPSSLTAQIGAGLLTPLLAALWPVLQGVAISVRQALAAYGLGTGHYGAGWLDKVLGKVRGIPRLSALALRNTFRRMGRVILTEVTLIMAGAVFMMVVSTNHSFNQTIVEIYRGFGWDVILGFEQLQRIDEAIPLIGSYPGVGRAEMWIWRSGALRLAKGVNYDVRIRAIPRDTELFAPELTAGRNLDLNDGHALLLNQKLAVDMGVNVGDDVVLDLDDDGESAWTVVGLLFDLSGDQATAYVHLDTFNAELNQIGRAGVVEIRSSVTAEGQEILAKELRDFLDAKGMKVGFTDTAARDQEQANAQFNILTTLLMIMTFLMAVVGSFGLSGTLSINVLERRREIGVMRAVGASSGDVGFVFMGEGLLLGLVSWALAIPISIWGGQSFVEAIGTAIEFPAIYFYSPHGVWIWLGVVVALSLLASWLPARRATQISVRESLAYE
jgi:putative ABC transport system permease protein